MSTAGLLARSESKPPEVPAGQLRELVARRCFFETGFGTLSILPRAKNRDTADHAGTFLVMQPEMSYTVKSAPTPLWFQFNHHMPESDGKRQHLGALIVTLSKRTGSRRIEVYRNSRWTRPNSREILGEFSRSPDLSWERFVALSRESSSADADVRKVDDAFEGPWHAVPDGGDEYSWSYREFWNWAVSSYETTSQRLFGSLPQADRYRVSARLIAYTPTPVPSSSRPVVFYVNASAGDSVFIALYSHYSSGQDIRSWYWVQLK